MISCGNINQLLLLEGIPCHRDRASPGPDLGQRLLVDFCPFDAVLEVGLSFAELGEVHRCDLLSLFDLPFVSANLKNLQKN